MSCSDGVLAFRADGQIYGAMYGKNCGGGREGASEGRFIFDDIYPPDSPSYQRLQEPGYSAAQCRDVMEMMSIEMTHPAVLARVLDKDASGLIVGGGGSSSGGSSAADETADFGLLGSSYPAAFTTEGPRGDERRRAAVLVATQVGSVTASLNPPTRLALNTAHPPP